MYLKSPFEKWVKVTSSLVLTEISTFNFRLTMALWKLNLFSNDRYLGLLYHWITRNASIQPIFIEISKNLNCNQPNPLLRYLNPNSKIKNSIITNFSILTFSFHSKYIFTYFNLVSQWPRTSDKTLLNWLPLSFWREKYHESVSWTFPNTT